MLIPISKKRMYTLYTAALSACHIAKLNDYKDIAINNKAIDLLYRALISPYNSIEFVNSDRTYNYNNVVNDLITTFATSVSYVNDSKSKKKVEELVLMFVTES